MIQQITTASFTHREPSVQLQSIGYSGSFMDWGWMTRGQLKIDI